MTEQKISELAEQAELWFHSDRMYEAAKKFAELVAEAEREACAKVCDEKVDAEYATGKVDHNETGWTQACAIDIRARGQL